MNIRVSFIAGCAGFALVLSTITGLFVGVPVGMILLRGVVSALLFALFAVAAQVVVARFLPELDGLFRGQAPDADDEEQSPRVDIVIDDEENLSEDDAASAETGERSAAADALGDAAELVEVAEAEDELATEAEEASADERRNVSEAGYDPVDSVDADSVDHLPDVGGFSDGFSDVDEPDSGSDGSTRSGDQDPAMMARALQTMLKRDT